MRSPKVTRRLLLAALAVPAVARAQPAWPSRPLRFIVPFAAGGPVEVPARAIAEHLGPRLRQTVVVEPRPGAGGAIGVQAVVQANDPHVFVFTTGGVGILPSIQRNAGYDPLRDLVPVSLISESALAFNVRAESAIRDLPDLIARARAEPGRISFGSSGVGTTSHLVGELLKGRAAIDLLHVPFGGTGQGLAAIYAGTVDILVTDASVPIPHVRDGRMRTLAVTSAERTAALPGVPAAAETLAGFAMPLWYGLFGPASLPQSVARRLAEEMAPLRDGSDLARRMEAAGGRLVLSAPEVLAARLAAEVPMWREVVPAAGITPE